MLTILVYSLNYAAGLLAKLPFLRHSFERSLAELAILRKPDERVVLITPTAVDPVILSYHFRDLWEFTAAQQRSALSRLVQLTPDMTGAESLESALLGDRSQLDYLQQEAALTPATIVNFAPSKVVEELGRRIGVGVVERPYVTSQRWGSKAGSKAAFLRSNVQMPRGTCGPLNNAADVAAACLRLAETNPPVECAVVKLNDPSWSAGIGNAVIDCRRLRKTGSLAESVTSLLQPWERFAAEIPNGVVVEEYVSDVVCSPSGQAFITDDGQVVVRSTHEQTLDLGQYLGCSFPARTEFIAKVQDGLGRVGRTLAADGVRGTFGIDFVGSADGELFALEINVRKVAPTHVLSYVESAVGARVGPDGQLCVAGRPVHYYHRRSYEPELFRFLDCETVIATLRERGLLYTSENSCGVILHILGAIPTCGYLETTCVARNLRAARDVHEEVRSVLLEHARLGAQ